jgi:DNA repair protein RadD
VILRDYQQRSIDEARAAFTNGHRRVLIVTPTGGGKTVIASEMIRLAVARGKRVLFLAHREELIKQSAAKLAACGVTDVRVIRAGSELGDPVAPVVVASIPTLCRPRWLINMPPADLVVFDEAHHVTADTWSAIANCYARAHILGMTATPKRADGAPLGDVFDAMVIGPSVRELTDLGHLVPCRVFGPACAIGSKSIAMTPADAYALHGRGRRAIVFCQTVDHARRTCTDMAARGIRTDVISGDSTAAHRTDVLARFAAGALEAVCNVHVLTEGFDDPGASLCILARSPGHIGTYIQMVGRVLRPAPGKVDAVLVDLCGSAHIHGMPDADREYSLDGEGIAGATRDAISQCVQCGAVYAARPGGCPECGYQAASKTEDPTVIGGGITEIRFVVPMPRVRMKAKYAGFCADCGKWINIGADVRWAKGEKPIHEACAAGGEYAQARQLIAGML